MTASSPYRAPARKPLSTFGVLLFSVPRGLLVALLALVAGPICLHIFLWSRVVTVQCQRAEGRQITCAVDEVSLASSSHTERAATGALAAEVRGERWRSRGDAWIVLIDRKGEAPLTSGFNGDKVGQNVAALALSDFLGDPRASAVTVSFGSRWRTLWIFGVIDAFLLLVLYPVLGQRLRVTLNRERDEIVIHRRVWPLSGARIQLLYSRLDRFYLEALPNSRYRLAARTNDGQSHPVSQSLAAGALLEPTVDKLNQWTEAERARDRA